MTSSEIPLWDRQPGETRKQFHAFTLFRDQTPQQRTLVRAFSLDHATRDGRQPDDPSVIPLLKPNKRWKDWKRQWNWDVRADAHDAEVAERDRQKRIAEIAQMNDRHASIAIAMQDKLIARLTTLEPQSLSAGQFAVWLREAALIERRARGESTSIVQMTEQPAYDLSKLTDAELDEWERLMTKAAPSPPAALDVAPLIEQVESRAAAADGDEDDDVHEVEL